MVVGSRRASVHTVQGFCVSILPQVVHTTIFSIAICSALASGAINRSRFLIKCSAARRAERGPSPGRRASSWIRRSISGPATAGMRSFFFLSPFFGGGGGGAERPAGEGDFPLLQKTPPPP